MTTDESDDKNWSQGVIDIMRIATMCRKYGMGEIIWVSWVPKKDEPSGTKRNANASLQTTNDYSTSQ